MGFIGEKKILTEGKGTEEKMKSRHETAGAKRTRWVI
jgi:hypothetical protein